MSITIKRALMQGASALSILVANALSVQAQEADTISNFTVLETLMVTGERVERSVFDTASSVEVVSDEQLKKKAPGKSVKEIVDGMANVHMPGDTGAPVIRGQATEGPNRGVGAFTAGTVPRATLNVDGRYLSFNELYFGTSSLWDVESVEVFRGPQTTSQGANSIAGAIIVNTKDPTFTPEAAYQVIYGSNNMKRASVAFSGPIIEDELAARLALDYFDRDTYVDFVNPAFDPGNAETDILIRNGRFKLLWTPSSVPGLEAKLTYSHSESNGPQAESVSFPFDNWESTADAVVGWPIKSDAVIADVSYEMDNGITLFNQFQYSQADIERRYRIANLGTVTLDQTDVSNETRATFEAMDGRLTGVLGLFARQVVSDEYMNLLGDYDFDDTKTSVGVYSELTYDITDRWSVTGGLRYQYDKVERLIALPTGSTHDYQENFGALLPKLSVSYKVTPDIVIGGLVSRGYNPGGVSLRSRTNIAVPFQQETAWNYELFGRANLLDDRLTLTGNLFYTDHRDAQRNVINFISSVFPESVTVNAERARSYGLEVGGTYRFNDAFQIYGSAGLLRTEIVEFTNSAADFEGKEFERSPRYSFSIGANWDITEQWAVNADLRHVGSYFSDSDNDPQFKIEPYTVANAQVSYKPRDEFEVFGYVKNIFNDTSPTSISNFRGSLSGSVVRPREFGIGVRGQF